MIGADLDSTPSGGQHGAAVSAVGHHERAAPVQQQQGRAAGAACLLLEPRVKLGKGLLLRVRTILLEQHAPTD